MRVLTIKEAVEWVNKGNTLEGVILDLDASKQVNVRDAIVLVRGGMSIPEENIFYNDDEIEYDEDIDELMSTGEIVQLTWEEKAKRSHEFKSLQQKTQEVMVDLSTQKPEVDDWIAKNKEKIEYLLRPIVINLFNAEKAAKE